MKAKDQWFAIFGNEGASFVKGIINGILGVMLCLLVVLAVVRLLSDLAKMKVTEDEDKLRIIKTNMKRTVAAFMLGALATALMILILNIIPRPTEKVTDSSWFDKFGGQKGEVAHIVNWIFAGMTAIIIVLFLLTTPFKIIKWMYADEDKKREAWRSIPRNIIIVVLALTITLTMTIVMNLVPNPAQI